MDLRIRARFICRLFVFRIDLEKNYDLISRITGAFIPLVIPRRRGWSRFLQFFDFFFIARAPSRIRTNPETRVGSFRELRPNSFRKIKKIVQGGTTICFSDTTCFCRFLKSLVRLPGGFFEEILRLTRFLVVGMSLSKKISPQVKKGSRN